MEKAEAEDWSFLDIRCSNGVYTVPGDGMVDYRVGVHANCPAIRGWVVVEAEQDPKKANPLHLCQDGLRQSDAASSKEAGLK